MLIVTEERVLLVHKACSKALMLINYFKVKFSENIAYEHF